MSGIPDRFPKIMCPYERVSKDPGSKSFIESELKDEYSWVLEKGSLTIEKLHGTNVGVKLQHNEVSQVAVRHGSKKMNPLDPFGSESHQKITRGVQNSLNKGFMYQFSNGWVFGELVGPQFNGNPYDLNEHLFIPFDWIMEHCQYEDFPKTGFQDIRDWMKKESYSHFTARVNGMKPSDASVSDGYFVEGVVMVHPEFRRRITPSNLATSSNSKYNSFSTELAKIRRDMFKSIPVKKEFPDIDT